MNIFDLLHWNTKSDLRGKLVSILGNTEFDMESSSNKCDKSWSCLDILRAVLCIACCVLCACARVCVCRGGGVVCVCVKNKEVYIYSLFTALGMQDFASQFTFSVFRDGISSLHFSTQCSTLGADGDIKFQHVLLC
jgi:hypothetical protein